MNLSNVNRLSPERYLANKQYFDSSLIELLEKQQEKLNKTNETIEIQKATIYKYSAKIKMLNRTIKNKDVIIHTLKNQNKNKSEDYEETIKELEDDLKKIHNTVNDELQKSYIDNARLNDENAELRKELERLRKQLNKGKNLNSTNSNLPPSTDMVPIRTNMRVKSNRKIGGQKGHVGHFSKMNEECSMVIEKHVVKAPTGAEVIKDKNGNILYYRTQEIDISFSSLVYETRYYTDSVETLSQEELKKYAINSVSYSNKLKSMVIYLNTQGDIALKRLSEMMKEMSNNTIDVKPSTIVTWLKEFDKKASIKKEEILKEILSQSILHVDETGWRIDGKQAWLHAIANRQGTYYVVTQKRSDRETGPLKLLKEYNGTVTHDHFKPYYELSCKHAECNAHILRYLKAGFEGYENLDCQRMIQLLQKMNQDRKNKIKENQVSFNEKELQKYEEQYDAILKTCLDKFRKENPRIARKYVPDYIKVFERMQVYKKEHLVFLHDFAVPFDNNLAERQIRVAKIKKKVSGQSKNIENANYFATILSIIQTCKCQETSILKAFEGILN